LNSSVEKLGFFLTDLFGSHGIMHERLVGRLVEVFDKFETSVDLLATSEVNVSLTIDDTRHLNEIVSELKKFSTVTVEHSKAIVCLVGEQMRYTPGIAARVFGAVRDVNVNMISQGASEINLSFIVNESDAQTVVRKLHHEFFE